MKGQVQDDRDTQAHYGVPGLTLMHESIRKSRPLPRGRACTTRASFLKFNASHSIKSFNTSPPLPPHIFHGTVTVHRCRANAGPQPPPNFSVTFKQRSSRFRTRPHHPSFRRLLGGDLPFPQQRRQERVLSRLSEMAPRGRREAAPPLACRSAGIARARSLPI